MKTLSKYDWVAVLNNRRQPTLDELTLSIEWGIPDYLRGTIWPYLAKVQQTPQTDYLALKQYEDSTVLGCIDKDLNRTFPDHHFFADPCQGGQLAIRNVLKAYAQLDPEVGYCQGMGFIAGFLLIYIPSEEQAFWTFVYIMNTLGWREMFLDQTPLLKKALVELVITIEQRIPYIAEHLEDQDIPITVFLSYYLTIFTYKTEIQLATRVFDLVLLQGTQAITKVLCKMLLLKQEYLLTLHKEDLYKYLVHSLAFECSHEFALDQLMTD